MDTYKLSKDIGKGQHTAPMFLANFPKTNKKCQFGAANLPQVYSIGFISSLKPEDILRSEIDISEARPMASE